MAATFHTAALNNQGKITKIRTRSSVKPILKKLHSSSHSEKNSLDLDRAWEEQQSPYAPDLDSSLAGKRSLDGHGNGQYHPYGYSHSYSYNNHYFTPTQPPPQRDVSFDLSASTTNTSSLATPCSSASASASVSQAATNNTTATATSTSLSNANTHNRSTSGASHISVATTASTSGGPARNGSFVHPFQQTPRTSTPPLLSYATSLASLGGDANNNSNSSRNYSPTTITENDDNKLDLDDSFPLPQPGVKPLQPTLPHSHSNSASAYRRPSLGSQRTSSLSETQPSSLRIATRAAGPVTVVDDSPIALSAATPQLSSTATASPMSPLRNSLDMANFRIRSRSDVDTSTRQEQVRVARRKFEEKERVKEEKYARADLRKRERADTKEARAAHSRKSSFGTPGRKSSSDIVNRPEPKRKSTSHSRSNSEKPSSPGLGISGQDLFATSNGAYEDITGTTESTAPSQPTDRTADEVHFDKNHRSGRTAKRKTQGTWTAFMLWFRTRLLKLGRR